MTSDVSSLTSVLPHPNELLRKNRSRQYFVVASTPLSEWQRIDPILLTLGLSKPDSDTLAEWKTSSERQNNDHGGKPPDISTCERLLAAVKPPALIDATNLTDPEQLLFWIGYFSNTELLLLHTRPESALIRAMAAGLDPTDFLDSWRACAQGLLQVYRSNRKRVSLIDVECALASPESFANVCRNYLELPDNGLLPEVHSWHVVVPEVYRLIAAQIVAQTPGLISIIDELEACSLPIGDPSMPGPVDCSDVYRTLQLRDDQFKKLVSDIADKNRQMEDLNSRFSDNARQVSDMEKKIANAERENEELLLRLHQIQEELETYYLKSESETTARSALERKLLELQDDHETDRRWMKHHERQSRKLRGQLKTTRSALESHREKLVILERNYKDQNRVLRYMVNSRSWNITAPLRAFYHRFMYKPGRSRPR